jgi:hypothetical protein
MIISPNNALFKREKIVENCNSYPQDTETNMSPRASAQIEMA